MHYDLTDVYASKIRKPPGKFYIERIRLPRGQHAGAAQLASSVSDSLAPKIDLFFQHAPTKVKVNRESSFEIKANLLVESRCASLRRARTRVNRMNTETVCQHFPDQEAVCSKKSKGNA